MNSRVWLSSPEIPEVELYSIEEADLENLRNWKNEHRESFFLRALFRQRTSGAGLRLTLSD